MTVLREADLSHGWSARFNADGTLTIDHEDDTDGTKVLTIPKESVERLQRIVHDIKEERK